MVKWKDGLFVPVGTNGTGMVDRIAAEGQADDLFLAMLDRFERQGRTVSHNKSPSYAPAVFVKEPDSKTAGVTRAALEAAMSRLFNANEIHVETYGRPSRPYSKLVRGARK
jgi:hypothetical protein